MKVPTALTGAAGEYHVAAALSRRGWLATVTIKNAPRTDVLAQHAESGRIISIQTKTASPPGTQFRLGGPTLIEKGPTKDELPAENDNEWYILAGLRDASERPDFYIVPRNIIAAMTYLDHRDWLRRPGPGGKRHNDSPVRVIKKEYVAKYIDRWDLLQSSADRTPYLGDARFKALARELGLPKGHPGL